MKNNFSPDIETTADGSLTLYRKDIDEHYHSIKGAMAESLHVYVETGWKAASKMAATIKVLEVGFGTGLNAALTAQAAAEAKIETDYHAVELFPLDKEITDRITDCQPSELATIFGQVNNSGWNMEVEINPFFRLKKILADFLTMKLPDNIDVVYFDAFAPEKQPEMWSEEIFSRIFKSMSPKGVLATYCSKGTIRRLLQKIGFIVERLPGPPSGKREILRATRPINK